MKVNLPEVRVQVKNKNVWIPISLA
jgi:hypothetical protein